MSMTPGTASSTNVRDNVVFGIRASLDFPFTRRRVTRAPVDQRGGPRSWSSTNHADDQLPAAVVV